MPPRAGARPARPTGSQVPPPAKNRTDSAAARQRLPLNRKRFGSSWPRAGLAADRTARAALAHPLHDPANECCFHLMFQPLRLRRSTEQIAAGPGRRRPGPRAPRAINSESAAPAGRPGPAVGLGQPWPRTGCPTVRARAAPGCRVSGQRLRYPLRRRGRARRDRLLQITSASHGDSESPCQHAQEIRCIWDIHFDLLAFLHDPANKCCFHL